MIKKVLGWIAVIAAWELLACVGMGWGFRWPNTWLSEPQTEGLLFCSLVVSCVSAVAAACGPILPWIWAEHLKGRDYMGRPIPGWPRQ